MGVILKETSVSRGVENRFQSTNKDVKRKLENFSTKSRLARGSKQEKISTAHISTLTRKGQKETEERRP